MARTILQSTFNWLMGAFIGFVITRMIMKLGWEDKEGILILGYAVVWWATNFYNKVSNQFRVEDLADIEKRFIELDKYKADKSDMNLLAEKISEIKTNQAELLRKFDNLNDYLLNHL